MVRAGAVVGAAVALTTLLGPTAANALWSAAATGSAQIGADTMANASTFTTDCSGSSIVLTWTRSPDADVTAYRLLRTGSNGSSLSGDIAATRAATQTYADTPPTLRAAVTYTYTIRAVVQGWTTTALQASSTGTMTNGKCA